MTGIIVTGILISKVVFPHLLSGENHALREIHDVFAKLTLLLVGVHIALHWQWIMGMFRKMLKTKEGNWNKKAIVTSVFILALFIGSMQWLATNVKPNEAFKTKFEQKVAQASETFPPPGKFRERPHEEHHGNSHPLLVILGHFTF